MCWSPIRSFRGVKKSHFCGDVIFERPLIIKRFKKYRPRRFQPIFPIGLIRPTLFVFLFTMIFCWILIVKAWSWAINIILILWFIGGTFQNVGWLVAPVGMGRLYSWSLTNIKISENSAPLGFPFNQYLAYFVLSAWAIFIAVVTTFLPDRMNRKVTKTSSAHSSLYQSTWFHIYLDMENYYRIILNFHPLHTGTRQNIRIAFRIYYGVLAL